MPYFDDWVRFPKGGSQKNRRRRYRPRSQQTDLISVMNNTRWRKLRAAMLALGPFAPLNRVMHVEYGDLTGWDGEWLHHFRLPDYSFIEWLDLKPRTPARYRELHAILKRLHLPGEAAVFTDPRRPWGKQEGFRIFGYMRAGRALDYIR